MKRIEKRNLVSVPVLILIIIILNSYAHNTYVFGQTQSISSTEPNLTTQTTQQSVLYESSQIVQPSGQYKFNPNATISSYNNNENIKIIPENGLGTYSYFQSNDTFTEYLATPTALCHIEISYKDIDYNLKQNIIGTGSCPEETYTFKIYSVDSHIPSTTSCSVIFESITYSWCFDTIIGATISYSGGIISIVTTSPTFNIDPSVIQEWQGTYNSQVGTFSCGASSMSVTSGDIIDVFVDVQGSSTATIGTPSDNLSPSTSYHSITTNSITGNAETEMFYGVTTASGTDTVSVSISPNEYGAIWCMELSGVTSTGIGSSVGTCTSGGGCSSPSSVASYSPSTNSIIVAGVDATSQQPTTAGTGYTCVVTNAGSFPCSNYNSNPGHASGEEYYSNYPGGATTSQFNNQGGGDWQEISVYFPVAPSFLILIVNPSPSPNGGAILITTSTTVSSTSTLTVSASSLIITAIAFSSYLWAGWSGATTVIQDTVNPTQTVTSLTARSSYTITGNFNTASGSSSPILTPSYSPDSDPTYPIVIMLVSIVLVMLFLALRRD